MRTSEQPSNEALRRQKSPTKCQKDQNHKHSVNRRTTKKSWLEDGLTKSPRKDYIRAKNQLQSASDHSAHKSSNHRFPKTHKTSPDTSLYKTYKNTKHNIFEELVHSILPLLEKEIRLGHTGIMDPFIDLRIPDSAQQLLQHLIGMCVLCVGGWNNSVGRAPDSRPKGLRLNPGRSSGRIFFSRFDFLC